MRVVNLDAAGQGPAKGAVVKAARAFKLALASFLGCALLFELLFPRHDAIHPRTGAPLVAQFARRSAFETAFARAQQNYLRAQVVAKLQLEALEEWDGDSIRGSAPERYRHSLIASTREIGWAEAAARDAVHQATTDDGVYRATRLLLHVERARGAALWN